MNKRILLYLLFIGMTFSSYNNNQKEKDIVILLETMGTSEMAVQAMIEMIDLYKEMMPTVPEQFWRDFMSEVKTEDIINLSIPIYEKYFTHNDIKELIKWLTLYLLRKCSFHFKAHKYCLLI